MGSSSPPAAPPLLPLNKMSAAWPGLVVAIVTVIASPLAIFNFGNVYLMLPSGFFVTVSMGFGINPPLLTYVTLGLRVFSLLVSI